MTIPKPSHVGSPLVWVVTPVYNGADYLRETIESVLRQTYEHWQYTIVDNCSTDGTREIARAARDERIALCEYGEFLPTIANWNRALRLLPAHAKYCKVVHADDVLLPQCLEKMVAVAEAHPTVDIVTSYVMWGDEVRHGGYVPTDSEVVDGRDIGRATLEGRTFVFGSPSSLLIRGDAIRARDPFYNEENVHADTEVCFEILRESDLGFVHDVLTRTRLHERALTSLSSRINTYDSGWLMIWKNLGASYMSGGAYRRGMTRILARYAVFLVKSVAKGRLRDPAFRTHHRRTVGYLLRRRKGTRSRALTTTGRWTY